MKQVSAKSVSESAARPSVARPSTARVLKRAALFAFLFCTALLITGTPALPAMPDFGGVYPFGIALLSAVSGAAAAVTALAGTLVAAAGLPSMGAVYAVFAVTLAAARLALSVWIAGLPKERIPPRKALYRSFASFVRHPIAYVRERRGDSTPLFSLLPPETAFRENIRLRMALSACMSLFIGAAASAANRFSPISLFGALFGVLITPAAVLLFYAASDSHYRASPLREPGICFSAAVLTLSLHCLTRAAVPGLSPRLPDAGILAAFLVSAAFSAAYGVHRGVLAAVSCGLTMQPAMSPAYGISAILTGVLFPRSPTLSVLAGGAGVCAWSVYTGGMDGLIETFPPVVIGCAVLIPLYRYRMLRLPEALYGSGMGRTNLLRGAKATLLEAGAKETEGRVSALSDGLTSISALLGGLSERLSRPSRTEMGEIAAAGFDAYCGTCRQREKCLSGTVRRLSAGGCGASGETLIEETLSRMTDELCGSGRVSAGAVPPSLASNCWNMSRILDEINREAGRRAAQLRGGDRLGLAAEDYGIAGELMRQAADAGRAENAEDGALAGKLKRLLSWNDFAAASVLVTGSRTKHVFVSDIDLTATRMGESDLRRLFEEAAGLTFTPPVFTLDGAVLSMRMDSVPSYRCVSGTYTCPAGAVKAAYGADGQAEVRVTGQMPELVSGDVITAFESRGVYYMILSDGMGSGKEAALTSGVVVSLLERLIRAGGELETALRMLNGIVRSTGRECSATIDIAAIDLVSGEARFIKSGAAPSFILRDGSIFRLQSKTVPIGILRALDAEMIRFEVQKGDTVVMLSDGVARSYEDAPWLLDLMTDDELILGGEERSAAMRVVSEAAIRGSEDDITAGVVRVS